MRLRSCAVRWARIFCVVTLSSEVVLHPHGLYMLGRWVGLSYDTRIMTGWSSMGPSYEEAEAAARHLSESEGATRDDGSV